MKERAPFTLPQFLEVNDKSSLAALASIIDDGGAFSMFFNKYIFPEAIVINGELYVFLQEDITRYLQITGWKHPRNVEELGDQVITAITDPLGTSLRMGIHTLAQGYRRGKFWYDLKDRDELVSTSMKRVLLSYRVHQHHPGVIELRSERRSHLNFWKILASIRRLNPR